MQKHQPVLALALLLLYGCLFLLACPASGPMLFKALSGLQCCPATLACRGILLREPEHPLPVLSLALRAWPGAALRLTRSARFPPHAL